ncbi:CHAT domain-containing protein [Stieleria varia]|uniref:CHAT domain protein n=1 Tax=Stieleria varia TaxID=2528005 RepID=A0A5C5ZYL4_9BACT|nr:CHAT domain-containing protein [Stieleria varia]TWT92724.1 CHAT domain protein [Stieleria varia]
MDADPNVFSVRIASSAERGFAVEVDSPVGRCQSTLVLPWPDESALSAMLARLPQAVRGQRALELVRPNADDTDEAVDAQTIGEQLFDALFHGESLALLSRNLDALGGELSSLQIRLHIDQADPGVSVLNRLPWELMRDRRMGEYLGLSNRTPIVRYLEVPRNYTAFAFKPPFRVLVVMSNPDGVAKLDLDRERSLIESSWGKRDDVQVDFLSKATTDQLQRRLQGATYHVLHFMGHGTFDRQSGVGKLVMENEDGSACLISGEALGRILRDTSLRLVFLNACQTAQVGAGGASSIESQMSERAFSGVASSLVLAGLPAVLAMQFPISDTAAIAFSETFYRLLPQCRPLEYVVAEARKRVDQLQFESGATEWATPVLFSRLGDGRIFESPFRVTPLDDEQQELLSRLTLKMRRYWIEGKLDKDIPIKPPIELTKELCPKALDRAIDDYGQYSHAETSDAELLVPAGKTIASLFDENNRKLLILGEPGLGKTITLLALVQHLIQRHDADRNEPVPVVLMLSSWSQSKLSIADWIAIEIANKYKIPSRLAMRWTVTDHLMVMLDGLDEVPEENREDCVAAINQYVAQQTDIDGRCFLAVCCRFDDYSRLTNRFTFDGAIKLRPLSETQIRDFLEKFGDDLAELQQILDADPQLLSEAQSPLMLGLMSMAYSNNPGVFSRWRELASSSPESTHSLRHLLIETYVDQVFSRNRATPSRYGREEVMNGLRWLANQLHHQHQSVYLIENLQPGSLDNRFHGFLYFVLHSLVLGSLLGGVLMGVWHHSEHVDPSFPPASETQPYWLVITPIWVLSVALWDWWWTKRDRDRSPERIISRSLGSRAVHAVFRITSFYAIWVLLWMMLSAFVGQQDSEGSMLLWLSHPLSTGVTVAAMYALAVGGRDTLQYIGAAEQLRWSSKRAMFGAGIGLAIGFAAWTMYAISNWVGIFNESVVDGVDQDQRTVFFHLAFYLPLGLVYGFVFGGLKMSMTEQKTRPNEGIMLSINNSVYGGVVVGGVAIATMLILLPNLFPNSDWADDWPSYIWLGALTGMIAMFWFGLIDVVRHYCLRAILLLTKTAPWHLPRLFDQASDLTLLQKIGGGYIFRDRMWYDYFLGQSEATAESNDSNSPGR